VTVSDTESKASVDSVTACTDPGCIPAVFLCSTLQVDLRCLVVRTGAY